jgi:hypothetical protein
MREPAEYRNDQFPIPVSCVLEIYEGTFREEEPLVEIQTAEPLSPISVGDYLYEVSFPDPLAAASRSHFTGSRKAASHFNTSKGSSDAHYEGLRESVSDSRRAVGELLPMVVADQLEGILSGSRK